MIAVTLQEAKAKLNQLVEAARAGEDVVLMRGSKIIATLRPLNEEDLEISPRLSDIQAERFWAQLRGEKKRHYTSMEQAVRSLKRGKKK